MKRPRPRARLLKSLRAAEQIVEKKMEKVFRNLVGKDWQKLTPQLQQDIAATEERLLRDELLQDHIEYFQKLASTGDDSAAMTLFRVASTSNRELVSFLSRTSARPRLRALLETAPYWPANFPANRKKREALAMKLKHRGLGKRCDYNPYGKFDEDAPATGAALFISVCLLSLMRGLPAMAEAGDMRPMQDLTRDFPHLRVLSTPSFLEWWKANEPKLPSAFTSDNARQWAKLTEPLLNIFWGENFHEHPRFVSCRTTRSEIRRLYRQAWHSIGNRPGIES